MLLATPEQRRDRLGFRVPEPFGSFQLWKERIERLEENLSERQRLRRTAEYNGKRSELHCKFILSHRNPTEFQPIISQKTETKKANVFTFALWVGKLPTSRRYNLLPLLRSSPGGFAGSWPYRTYPYTCFLKDTKSKKHTPVSRIICVAKVVYFSHLSKHKAKIIYRTAIL